MQQTNKSKGLPALAAIVIVITIGLAGLGGWYIWNKNNSSDKPNNQAQTQQAREDQTSQENTTLTDLKEGKYLVIREWGIKVLLRGTLQNDIYRSEVRKGVVESPSLAYEPATPLPSERISLGSRKLDQLAAEPGQSLDQLMFVERTGQEYPAEAVPYSARNFKRVDGYWYTLRMYSPGVSTIAGYADHSGTIFAPLAAALQNLEPM